MSSPKGRGLLKYLLHSIGSNPKKAMQQVLRYSTQQVLRYSTDCLDYQRSQRTKVDMADIKSVCLTLGPYRNLTTLISVIIFLHPSCQVLNHGGERVFSRESVNFFLDYSESKFNDFVRYAIFISQKGRKGPYGGSITLSHAFDHKVTRQTYQNRYGKSLVKKDIRCLFWKDSLRISNFIKRNHINLTGIFSQNSRLRFLMSIRNPLDCAISNYRTGHALLFPNLKTYSLDSILDCVLNEISWFLTLQKEHPGKFFCFFENEFDENLLLDLAEFLLIEPDNDWIDDSLNCYRLKKPYDYEPEFVEHYNEAIQLHFREQPSVLEKLAEFSNTA